MRPHFVSIPKSLPRFILALKFFLWLQLSVSLASGETCVWTGAVDGNWDNPGNWENGIVPGVPDGSMSRGRNINDTAIFNAATPNQTIIVDADRRLAFVEFSGTAGAYTFQGGPLILTATWPDGIRINSPHVKTPQTFDLEVRPSDGGQFGFINAGGQGANLIFHGTVKGADEKTNTLLLQGPRGGEIVAPLADGAGGVLNVIKSGKGIWILKAPPSHTGATEVKDGELRTPEPANIPGASPR